MKFTIVVKHNCKRSTKSKGTPFLKFKSLMSYKDSKIMDL
jgi:hypothetical protein